MMKNQYIFKNTLFQGLLIALISMSLQHLSPAQGVQVTFTQWDSHNTAPSGQVLEKGANVVLKKTTAFPDVAHRMLSLGVFKMGEHRVVAEDAGAGVVEDLSFSVGWFVEWGELYFYQNKQHRVTENRTQLSLYWDYVYSASGVKNPGEVELFVATKPQIAGFTPAVYIYGKTSAWTSPAGKADFSSFQAPKNVVPLESITGFNGGKTIAYSGTNVSINGGSLKVDNSSVITQASVVSFGFINDSYLASNSISLSGGSATGLLTTGLSLGYALGDYSAGLSAGGALADYSTAMSAGVAQGDYSTAMSGGLAIGQLSFATGEFATASSYSSAALGSYTESWGSPTTWIETDPLLLVGNGDPNLESNAIEVLKNGQTTLMNKAWTKRSVSVPATADPLPADPNDAGGNALIVDGHTILNGKVIISAPQGDISMGIFE